jgi:hypothetical protein
MEDASLISNSTGSMKLGYQTAKGGCMVHCTENPIYVFPEMKN